MKGEMLLNKKIIIILCIFIIVILIFVGGVVLAKHQTQETGKGVAEVAKWVFNIDANSSTVKTVKLANSYDESTLTNGKIAPGTTGSFDILIDGTGSDVGVEYKVSFANETSKPFNLNFIYENVKYNSLKDLEKKLVGTIDANDENKKRTLKINWEWQYEIGSSKKQIDKNNKKDTQDSQKISVYTFDVVVTGVQATPTT